MALKNTGITSTIVANAIGESSRKWSVLCKSSKINKWSKWKPVSINKVTPITAGDLKNIDYGLKPPTPKTDYTEVVDVKWTYEKPTGSSTSPFRIGDFRNYYHNAGAIVSAEQDVKINKATNTTKMFGLSMNIGDSDEQIGLNDFSGVIGDYYYGIVFENGNNKYIQTATKTLAGGGMDFTANLNEDAFSGTSVVLNHLLCSKDVPTMQPLTSQGTITYMPLPSKDFEKGKVTASITQAPSVSVQVTHIAVAAGSMMFPIGNYIDGMNPPPFPTTGAVYLKLLLTNSSSTNVVFGGSFQIGANPTYFGANTNKFPATLSNNAGTSISSISVPANSSVSVNIGADAVMNRNGTSIGTPPLNTITATSIRVYQGAGTIATASIKCKANDS